MLAVDLNILKNDLSALQLDDNGTYRIYDRSGKFISEVDFSNIFFAIPFETTSIEGLLTHDDSGLYINGPLGVRIDVKSPLINIETLSNANVVLTGHMMTHSVSQPVFRSNVTAQQFIATGVSFSAAN